MKNYQCKKCGTLIQSEKTPSSFNCLRGGMHQWQDLGELGPVTYQCKKCGITINNKKTPSSFGCTAGGMHQWNKLSR